MSAWDAALPLSRAQKVLMKGSVLMQSYILRLYRRGNGDEEKVAGFLEGAISGTQSTFRDFDELRNLLLSSSAEEVKENRKAKD